jgi:hypothetical protein
MSAAAHPAATAQQAAAAHPAAAPLTETTETIR